MSALEFFPQTVPAIQQIVLVAQQLNCELGPCDLRGQHLFPFLTRIHLLPFRLRPASDLPAPRISPSIWRGWAAAPARPSCACALRASPAAPRAAGEDRTPRRLGGLLQGTRSTWHRSWIHVSFSRLFVWLLLVRHLLLLAWHLFLLASCYCLVLVPQCLPHFFLIFSSRCIYTRVDAYSYLAKCKASKIFPSDASDLATEFFSPLRCR